MNRSRNQAFFAIGLGAALLIGIFLSPFASGNPDGLNRVAADHGFEDKAATDVPAHRLPFYSIFDGYALRGVPEAIATPLAGLVGTLATFAIAWGAGKLLIKGSTPDRPIDDLDE